MSDVSSLLLRLRLVAIEREIRARQAAANQKPPQQAALPGDNRLTMARLALLANPSGVEPEEEERR